jgi:MFS family permease
MCALGVVLFISTQNLILASIGRFIIGFASSFAFIAVLKIARVYLPGKYFTRIVGVNVALGTLLASYGDVLATYLKTQHFKDVFYINIFIGLLLAALFAFFYWYFAEHPSERNSRMHHFSWYDLKVLLKNRALWINGLVGGLFYLPTTVLADVWGDYFLQNQYHLTLTQSSYVITWLFMGWMVGSPIMGYLADRFKSRRSIISVNALISAYLVWHLLFLPEASLQGLSGLMFLLGLSSSAQLIIWRIFHQLAPMSLAATGIALTNMIVMLTCALGQVVIGFFMSFQQNSDDITLYTNHDYHHSLMFLPIALIAAAFLVRLLPKAYLDR